jgi:hypothetical protein
MVVPEVKTVLQSKAIQRVEYSTQSTATLCHLNYVSPTLSAGPMSSENGLALTGMRVPWYLLTYVSSVACLCQKSNVSTSMILVDVALNRGMRY